MDVGVDAGVDANKPDVHAAELQQLLDAGRETLALEAESSMALIGAPAAATPQGMAGASSNSVFGSSDSGGAGDSGGSGGASSSLHVRVLTSVLRCLAAIVATGRDACAAVAQHCGLHSGGRCVCVCVRTSRFGVCLLMAQTPQWCVCVRVRHVLVSAC